MVWTDCDSTTGGDPDKPVKPLLGVRIDMGSGAGFCACYSIDATVARLFGVAHLLDDDAVWVELRNPGRPDSGSDHNPPIRQRLPDEIAPLGHRGRVPALRPFLPRHSLNDRVYDCSRHALQRSQPGAKLGNALVQRHNDDIITLERDQAHADQMVDQVVHAPVGARGGC
jgi:hypothetical protein